MAGAAHGLRARAGQMRPATWRARSKDGELAAAMPQPASWRAGSSTRARGGEAVFRRGAAFGVPTEAEVEAAMQFVKEERPKCESEIAELEAMIWRIGARSALGPRD